MKAQEITNGPQVMTWGEYNSSVQDSYLDEENAADQDVVFSNDLYEIRVFKTINHEDSHFFNGEDEDFAIIDSKDGSQESYLLYGCTLSEAINYIQADIITTMQELADYINAKDEWPLEVEDIIEANGWINDCGTDWGICHNDKEKVVVNDDGKAEVVILAPRGNT